MYGMSGFAEKLNSQNYVSSTGNCVQYLCGMSRLTQKLNVQNCENSTGKCTLNVRNV